jgi:hypothetical protein
MDKNLLEPGFDAASLNSPEWLHSGLWYFQLPQLFALANSMNVLDKIVVVGSDKSFEDDVVIALNGKEVMSLVSFHDINLGKFHFASNSHTTRPLCTS